MRLDKKVLTYIQPKRRFKMENENDDPIGCGTRTCSHNISPDGVLGCSGGDGDCWRVNLLEAEPSDFHDAGLIDATQKIKRILAEIPADEGGRKLSFVHTRMGTLLAWVKEGADVHPNAITAKDDDATIARALKLKDLKVTKGTPA